MAEPCWSGVFQARSGGCGLGRAWARDARGASDAASESERPARGQRREARSPARPAGRTPTTAGETGRAEQWERGKAGAARPRPPFSLCEPAAARRRSGDSLRDWSRAHRPRDAEGRLLSSRGSGESVVSQTLARDAQDWASSKGLRASLGTRWGFCWEDASAQRFGF